MSLQSSTSAVQNPLREGEIGTARSIRHASLLHLANRGARLALAGLFFWAGTRKAMEPALFLQDIESYEILPYRWAWLLSIWLPFLEITAAAALLMTRKWAQAGALVLGGLLLAFLGGIISAWARGLSLSCGCFGVSSEPSNYPWLVARDLLLLGLTAFIFLTTLTKDSKRS